MLKFPQIEFFSAIFSSIKDNEIVFETMIVPSSPEFSYLLPDLSEHRCALFGKFSRDWKLQSQHFERCLGCEKLCRVEICRDGTESLNPGDVIVLDGSLQTQFQNEGNSSETLEKATQDRGCDINKPFKDQHALHGFRISLLGAISQFANNEKMEGNGFIRF